MVLIERRDIGGECSHEDHHHGGSEAADELDAERNRDRPGTTSLPAVEMDTTEIEEDLAGHVFAEL